MEQEAALYDEFGNYLGEDIAQEDWSEEENDVMDHGKGDEMDIMEESSTALMLQAATSQAPTSAAIILHEDKKYYPSAEEVYGPDVETLVQEEDTQPLTQPIIAPQIVHRIMVTEKEVPPTTFDKSYLNTVMQATQRIRAVALVGPLGVGKTALIDKMIQETHPTLRTSGHATQDKGQQSTTQPVMGGERDSAYRYTDTLKLERGRGMTLKSKPISLLVDHKPTQTSYAVHVMDTPGHVNFMDQVLAALRYVDAVVLVVDAIDGPSVQIEHAIRMAAKEGLDFILVINKVDRLLLELRLPPEDTYFKLRHTVDSVNALLRAAGVSNEKLLSPLLGNVVFASPLGGWSMTLPSMAQLYAEEFQSLDWDVNGFIRRCWGDISFDPETRQFSKRFSGDTRPRSFVHFFLDPLYKIYAHVLGGDVGSSEQEKEINLPDLLASLNIQIKKREWQQDVKPLLRLILRRFMGNNSMNGLFDAVIRCVPHPLEKAELRTQRLFTGPMDHWMAKAMQKCDPEGPLIVHVAKLFPNEDASQFHALGRVLSGTVQRGQSVRVLGESFVPEEDEEDQQQRVIEQCWLYQTRYSLSVERVPAGNWVLIQGVDASIVKTATLIESSAPTPWHIVKPLDLPLWDVLKIAVEPVHPAELPKMLDALRKVTKTYPHCTTHVEESGEHTLLGTGELYLDCIMHDLRRVFADMEIKVSDPVARLTETCLASSVLPCTATSPNTKNVLTMTAEPLDKGLAEASQSGQLASMPPKQFSKYLQQEYGWDGLAASRFWTFGPELVGGVNGLLDDTLPGECDSRLLRQVRPFIEQGFRWATREGPLCEAPMRQVKFKILDAQLSTEAMYRGGGQLIPTARRVSYAAYLMATPRLMEPVYQVTVQLPADCITVLYTLLARRRGHVIKDELVPGSPLCLVKAILPVMDAVGFETDLRTHTQGQAYAEMIMDHWQMVPGDPLDTSIVLQPLEAAPMPGLARDFMIKTRRRKGLSEQVNVRQFFDERMLIALAEHEAANKE